MKGNYTKGIKSLINPLKNKMRKESRKMINIEMTLAYLPLQVRRDVSNLNFPAPVKDKSTDTTNRLKTTV